MPGEWTRLETNVLLPGKLFWQARGFFSSLPDYADSGMATNIKTTRVTPLVKPVHEKQHPLLVTEIPGGKMVGDTSVVCTRDDLAIGGLQALHCEESPSSHWFLRRRRFRIPRRIRGVALVLSSNGTNYFHWLFDSLPRLELFQKAGYKLDDVDWVLLGKEAAPFQEQMLGLLGIPQKKWFRCSKGSVYQFDKLIVPSMPVPVSGMTEPWIREFLRKRFLPRDLPAGNKSIYLSRRNSPRRKMVNEPELEARLQSLGFEVHIPETMTFLEQARLFASASLIVAPHGAALANIVFCNPGARLVELFHPEIVRNIYQELAETCQMKHEPVIGKNSSAHAARDDRDAEFAMDMESLIHMISGGKTAPLSRPPGAP